MSIKGSSIRIDSVSNRMSAGLEQPLDISRFKTGYMFEVGLVQNDGERCLRCCEVAHQFKPLNGSSGQMTIHRQPKINN